MIRITAEISLDEKDIAEEFMRSGGPGGQHVNKVSTAVRLRYNLKGAALDHDVKERLARIAAPYLSSDGTIIITSRESRSREANREAALARLVDLVRRAAKRPIRRVATRPTRGSKERRVEGKKARGRAKAARKKVGDEY